MRRRSKTLKIGGTKKSRVSHQHAKEGRSFSQNLGENLPYHGPIGELFAKFMTFYNRRFSIIAGKKIAKGHYGRKSLFQETRYLLTNPAPLAENPTSSNPLPASMTEIPEAGHDEYT